MGESRENLAQGAIAERAAAAGKLRARLTGVIYNPHSHLNRKLERYAATHPSVRVATPEDPEGLSAALAEFSAAGIEYLVINGGDGTVRDVLSAGLPIFGEHWPQLAVLPQGKTNALNVDLGAPNGWTIEGALDAFADGTRVLRRPLVVSRLDEDDEDLAGFILGAGAFTIGIAAGQDAHRLGAFNSLAVGVTAAWGVAQALFGSDRNLWRRGVGMRIFTGRDGIEMPHSGHGDPARRAILLASTLHRFPFGMKPFGQAREGLKIGVMDKPLRSLLLMLPRVLTGWEGDWLRRKGLHRVTTDVAELDLGGRFILDGEAFPAGRYALREGPELTFVVP